MSCFICLEAGGLEDACPCAATVHTACLAKFLERGFAPRCPVCNAAFTSLSRYDAAAHLFRQAPTPLRRLCLAAAATAHGLPEDALELLKSAVTRPVFRIPYNIELGHALLVLGETQQALRVLSEVLDALFRTQDDILLMCPSVVAHALTLSAKGHCSQGELQLAEGAVRVVLEMAPQLTIDECLDAMQVMVEICAKRNDGVGVMAARQTILNILTSEERRDPWEIAGARAELALAQIARGDSAAAAHLGPLLRVLRKRPSRDGLVERARGALVGRPTKRLRGKTPPEDA